MRVFDNCWMGSNLEIDVFWWNTPFWWSSEFHDMTNHLSSINFYIDTYGTPEAKLILKKVEAVCDGSF